jgi:hypothetical protein
MKKLITTTAALAIFATAAHAGEYTYMCKVGRKTYPVTVTTPNETKGDLEGGVITWRGTTFENVKLGDDCRYNFTATGKDGTSVELCTSTKGVADLKIGKDDFDCQMRGR